MWSSESLSIKYFNPNDNKYHTYFPDYVVRLSNGDTVNYIGFIPLLLEKIKILENKIKILENKST